MCKKILTGMWLMGLLSIVSIAGCGGGGGGSKIVVPKYSGAWSGGVSLISNNCAREIPDEFIYVNLLHNVEQEASRDAAGTVFLDVVLNDGTDTFTGLGEVLPDGTGNGFSVTGNPHELPGFLSGYTCIELLDWEYDSVEGNTAGFVSRHSSITCTRTNNGNDVRTCDVTYTGSAYRL